MAADKSDKVDGNITNIADAREERLIKSPIPYGRRHGDDPVGPEKTAMNGRAGRPDVRAVKSAATGGRRFDREKVEKIKAQLARGEYKIDSLRVADLFIEHERHT